MSRPTKDEQILLEERKRLMKLSKQEGFNQSDIGKIFRVPRNTASTILRQK